MTDLLSIATNLARFLWDILTHPRMLAFWCGVLLGVVLAA